MKLEKKKKSIWPLVVSAILIGLLIVLFFTNKSFSEEIKDAYHVLTSDDSDKIGKWVSKYGIWGPLVLILAMVVQLIFIFIPSVLIMVIAVLAYGPYIGTLITIVGITVSASLGYVIGDYFGEFTIEKIIGKTTAEKIEAFVNRYGIWTIIVVRASPFLSHDAVSLIGGVVEMSYRRFIFATLVGSAPLLLLVAIFGQSMESLKPGLIIGSIISIVVFIFYIILDKRRQKRSLKKA
jgi:uncharacterized membrane protein YdjX (TVP38/TMEM64 family)